ncbi:MAG TPA: hypothetical protein VD927_18530 [Chryseosolibacter sp.]|nr:hypothetical protein [Chryseosolibacter sp.]
MKTRITIAAVILLMITVTFSHAQNADASFVKILPAKGKGMIKVLYAQKIEEPILVTFYNNAGVIKTDRIKGRFEKGVLKKYDVNNINHKEYWVEVKNPRTTVTYHVVPTRDRENFTASIERVSYQDSVVAKNNQ